MSTNLKFRPTPTGMAPRLCFLPLVMLSGVGANATTQSKHPGAVGCDKVDTGSSTEGELPEPAFFATGILGMFRLRDATFRASLRST